MMPTHQIASSPSEEEPSSFRGDFLLPQDPDAIATRTHQRLVQSGTQLPRTRVEGEISELWGRVKNPQLLRYIGALAENALRKDETK